MRSLLLAGLAIASSIGCGDDASGIPLEAAPSAFAAAYCERAFACCETSEVQTLLGSEVVDRPSCEAFVARMFGNEFIDDTMRATAAGRARYDADAMAACIEYLRSRACVDSTRVFRLMQFPQECGAVRIGAVAIGGACDHDFQCAGGTCAGETDQATGSCEELPAIGAPCPGGDCGPTAYCDRSGVTPICAVIAATGEACTTSLGCESLNCAMGVCSPPLSCDGR